MARSNLLDTRTTNFRELIGNGKIYKVPPFQRDYSWSEENWEDLWQDIVALRSPPSSGHYMGALVLQSSHTSDKEFTIIDGQQRLATLSIITIAVLEKIQELINQEEKVEDNKKRKEILRAAYLSEQNPRSLRYSSKLFLNENNNDFYQSNLINLRKPRNLRSLTKSNQLLWKAFDYFCKCLDQLTEVTRSGEQLTTFLTDIVAEQLLFIQINVENELNAYVVFETLNARGIELSSTDLLKNYLFSLFRGPDDLKEAQRQWKRIIESVQMEKFPEFLRYYLSLRQTRVRQKRIFKIVRESVKDAQKAFDLLDQLENYSALFTALSNANDEFWRDRPEDQAYIRELELFRVKQSYPTLFAADQKFSPDNFTRLLKLICIVSFRYSVISHLNPNELETIYNKIAIAIMQDEISHPRQVFEKLNPVYIADQKFEQDFAFFAISTKGRKKKLVRYILRKLENDASKRDDLDEDNFSVEHILPESPTEEWRKNFTDSQTEEMIYRIGNLTPLEPKLNRQVGNESYIIKQETYQNSVYVLTQSILAEAWTPDTLATRQKKLAKRAVHIWKADFAS